MREKPRYSHDGADALAAAPRAAGGPGGAAGLVAAERPGDEPAPKRFRIDDEALIRDSVEESLKKREAPIDDVDVEPPQRRARGRPPTVVRPRPGDDEHTLQDVRLATGGPTATQLFVDGSKSRST